MVKNLRAMQGTRVRSLGWEDLLKKETATHSSILAWEIPLTEEPGGLHSPRARKEPETPWRLHTNKDGDVQNRHTDVRCGRGKSGDQG